MEDLNRNEEIVEDLVGPCIGMQARHGISGAAWSPVWDLLVTRTGKFEMRQIRIQIEECLNDNKGVV